MGCSCKSKKIGSMAKRGKKSNLGNLATNAVVGALGVVSSRVLSNMVGVQGQTGSIVKIGAGVAVGMYFKNPMAYSFGAGMAIDGAVDFVGPIVTPIVSKALPASLAGLPTMPISQEFASEPSKAISYA